MKKVNSKLNLKKLYLAVLAGLFVPGMPVLAQTQDMHISQDEMRAHVILDELLEHINTYVKKIQDGLDAFLSKKNKQTYAEHIVMFKQLHTDMRKVILDPFEQELNNVAQGTTDRDILIKVDGILHELDTMLANVNKALIANKSKNYLLVAKNLRSMKENMRKKMTVLIKQVSNLHTFLNTIPHCIMVADKVKELEDKMILLINADGASSFELLSCIKYRCNC